MFCGRLDIPQFVQFLVVASLYDITRRTVFALVNLSVDALQSGVEHRRFFGKRVNVRDHLFQGRVFELRRNLFERGKHIERIGHGNQHGRRSVAVCNPAAEPLQIAYVAQQFVQLVTHRARRDKRFHRAEPGIYRFFVAQRTVQPRAESTRAHCRGRLVQHAEQRTRLFPVAGACRDFEIAPRGGVQQHKRRVVKISQAV